MEAQLSRLLVVIPAFNEAETVAAIVTDARAILHADVVVIDDGSSDETAREARSAGATVLVHPFNLGVGGAIRTGLRYAARNGYGRVVQIDGDGQHLPTEAARLVECLDNNDVDVVVGSRFAGGYARTAAGYEVSLLRRFTMRVLSRMISKRLGTRVTDTTSGFRAFGPAALAVFAPGYPTAYLNDTVEALLICADHGLRVQEIAVSMRQRLGGAPSASHLRTLLHLMRVVLIVMLHRVRRPLSPRGVQ